MNEYPEETPDLSEIVPAVAGPEREPFIFSLSPQEIRRQRFNQELVFWLLAWLGTAFSGSAFGAALCSPAIFQHPVAVIAVIFASVFGFFIAGISAIPIIFTMAIVTWGLWLTRFRMITAAIAGGWTGVIATRDFLGGKFSAMGGAMGSKEGMIVMAGVFSAVVCPLFTYMFGRWIFARKKKNKDTNSPWQFTLSDLFVHFTVLAVLISLWAWYFTAIHDHNKQSQQPPAIAQPM